MPKQMPEEYLKEILLIVSSHPEGVGFKTIERESTGNVPRRTLQYRLQHLTNSGRLVAEGDRRGRIYKTVPTETVTNTNVIETRKKRSEWSFGGWE